MSTSGKTIDEDWFSTAFDALYPIIYAHRTVEAAAPEAAFAIAQTGIGPEDHVLDLCCGNGRHLLHLLTHTAHAMGLDYSPDLLRMARQSVGPDAVLFRADMRAIPLAGTCDVVLNFFTSFGYFQDEAENLAVLQGIAAALKPTGRFFLDYLNPSRVADTLVPHSERSAGVYCVVEDRWIDEASHRINKCTVVRQGGREVSRSGESVRLYSAGEMREMLAQAGLHVWKCFGDYAGSTYDERQERMIILGGKTPRNA